ncbi:DUF4386 domain-containing protein [Robiginitalea sp. M366]|uniref:DUF4386 domain-containing protein n=1 Tax=Robiginitalea aestuariiviva TaxID=3036903 RepID=UPI00240D83E0|nr:DUF4386 domain-containing protein [Robiginitalea aestuariiviva]MDG1573430.1 DUF4386 domain-containing protein [Robiginitalea aestuariiviva]
MTRITYAQIAGTAYLGIFFAAIFANFVVLEAIKADPLGTVAQHGTLVRLGIAAFWGTVVLDVVVAWALYRLYEDQPFSGLSTLFRVLHAALMAAALIFLQQVLRPGTVSEILTQVDRFEGVWLIGLFFFGIHLILLARILGNPRWLAMLLTIAGVMYMVDTLAHSLLGNYEAYAGVLLALVALPSVLGEMGFAVWLLIRGGREGDGLDD